MVEATLALNIPIGTPHPTVPNALAIAFNPESISGVGNAARVTVSYREFSQDYRVDISSRALDVETTQFITNIDEDPVTLDKMVLWYEYPDDYDKVVGFAGKRVKDGVLLSFKQYHPTITITRTEVETIQADAESGHAIGVKLTGEILTDRMIRYNGTIDDGEWDLRPNDGPGHWQCQISGASAEDGLAFRVSYIFSHADTWSYEATFKDPNTGEPVPDPVLALPGFGNGSEVLAGRKLFPQYIARDFNPLELV
jgi:hypothetical protein